MLEIDSIIRESLTSFADDIHALMWRGRENEAVNLFVFSHLLSKCKVGTCFYDPGQLCIECAIPQVITSGNHKTVVRKDLIVWPQPKMTCWHKAYQLRSEGECPIALLEWKVSRFNMLSKPLLATVSKKDIEWLSVFTQVYTTIGYAVSVQIGQDTIELRCARVEKGMSDIDWLIYTS